MAAVARLLVLPYAAATSAMVGSDAPSSSLPPLAPLAVLPASREVGRHRDLLSALVGSDRRGLHPDDAEDARDERDATAGTQDRADDG